MPTYAILGATGNTGQALVQILLQDPTNIIHAYSRSKSKLHRLTPATLSNPQVRVFEGNLQDVELIKNCIRGTRAVFLVVAIVDNMPGCTIAYDTAQTVVSALEILRKESEPESESESEDGTETGAVVAVTQGGPTKARATIKIPKLLILSSASLEPTFCDDVPRVVHTILTLAVSHLYSDLQSAEQFLRSHSEWISSTFIKPGGLVKDRQGGHEISLVTSKTPLSFLDLAAGMVEVADDDGNRYDGRNVSVLPKAVDVGFPWEGVYFAFTGLLFHFMPWTYRFLGEYNVPEKRK
jgi:hypothetical protein